MLTEPANAAAETPHQEPHIGAQLKAARDQVALSLNEISKSLNISEKYLGAIERLDKAALPSMGYSLGFVRAYAKHVGLDSAQAVARYKVDIECPKNMGVSDCPHHIPRRVIRLPKGSIAAGLVLFMALGFITWYGMKSDTSSAMIANAAVPETETWAQAVSGVTQDEDIISLVAIGPSWAEVRDAQGNILMSRIMVPGDVFEVSRLSAPLLSVRDAGAIELYVGGRKIGPIGQKGARAENIPLASAVNVDLPSVAAVSTSMR